MEVKAQPAARQGLLRGGVGWGGSTSTEQLDRWRAPRLRKIAHTAQEMVLGFQWLLKSVSRVE